MFESLKAKMKGLFSKGGKLKEEDVYKHEETEQIPAPQPPVQPSEPKVEEVKVPEPVSQPEPEAAPAPAPEPPKEEPKLSRKEMLKLKKQEKKEAKHHRETTEAPVGDSGKRIKEDPLDEILNELEIILLEADVAYPVVEEIKAGVRENLVGKKYDRSYTLEQVVELAIKDAVRDVLKINEFDFDGWLAKQERPTVVMFVGINGTGKTTAIAKIANRIMKNGETVGLAACDGIRHVCFEASSSPTTPRSSGARSSSRITMRIRRPSPSMR